MSLHIRLGAGFKGLRRRPAPPAIDPAMICPTCGGSILGHPYGCPYDDPERYAAFEDLTPAETDELKAHVLAWWAARAQTPPPVRR